MRLSFVLNLLLLLVSSLFHKAWAQVAAPSSGGSISITQINATTMSLKVGSNGTGQGRVVSIATTSYDVPVKLAPTNGQFYKGSTTFGQGDPIGRGYVVYSGSGNSITITGLQPNTNYYISNAEYNTDNISIMYNTVGTNTSITTRKAPATPLPVELIAFSGSVDIHSLATLRWRTASERNTDYFAIEYSADGTTFSETARLTAAGTSSNALSYQWNDSQPLTGTIYSRLRQVDKDGTVYYSQVITLQPAVLLTKQLSVYPNPGTCQEAKIAIQGYKGETITIYLFDTMGRLVSQQTVQPSTANYLIPISLTKALTAGSYIVTVKAGVSSPVQKRLVITE